MIQQAPPHPVPPGARVPVANVIVPEQLRQPKVGELGHEAQRARGVRLEQDVVRLRAGPGGGGGAAARVCGEGATTRGCGRRCAPTSPRRRARRRGSGRAGAACGALMSQCTSARPWKYSIAPATSISTCARAHAARGRQGCGRGEGAMCQPRAGRLRSRGRAAGARARRGARLQDRGQVDADLAAGQPPVERALADRRVQRARVAVLHDLRAAGGGGWGRGHARRARMHHARAGAAQAQARAHKNAAHGAAVLLPGQQLAVARPQRGMRWPSPLPPPLTLSAGARAGCARQWGRRWACLPPLPQRAAASGKRHGDVARAARRARASAAHPQAPPCR